MRKTMLRMTIIALALTALGGPAMAAAIDGNWCHNDGRRFSIRGPDIVTPGGKPMQGNYSRHFFDYIAPAAEPGAGQVIQMTLLNENTVSLRVGAAGAPETWVRCSPSVSALEGSTRS